MYKRTVLRSYQHNSLTMANMKFSLQISIWFAVASLLTAASINEKVGGRAGVVMSFGASGGAATKSLEASKGVALAGVGGEHVGLKKTIAADAHGAMRKQVEGHSKNKIEKAYGGNVGGGASVAASGAVDVKAHKKLVAEKSISKFGTVGVEKSLGFQVGEGVGMHVQESMGIKGSGKGDLKKHVSVGKEVSGQGKVGAHEENSAGVRLSGKEGLKDSGKDISEGNGKIHVGAGLRAIVGKKGGSKGFGIDIDPKKKSGSFKFEEEIRA